MTNEEIKKRFRYDPVKDRLGEGGFGEVFKAYDTYSDCFVAIKISRVKPDLAEIRLKKEVELVNMLPKHPYIARYDECYTVSSLSGDLDFAILQYYELGNLLQLMQGRGETDVRSGNPLSLEQKQKILEGLMEGIGFIHSHGIIHRDLKPQNILIAKRGNDYIPKITDFGISKKLGKGHGSIYTNSLAGAGTLAYTSPEQLAGKPIRKNTDLWSLGVIAYQLFLNKLPFNSGGFETNSEAGRMELVKQINKGVVPQEINSIPFPYNNLIRHCLQVDPEQRVRDIAACREICYGSNEDPTVSGEKAPSEFDGSGPTVVEIRRKTQVKERSVSGRSRMIRWGAVGLVLLVLAVLVALYESKAPGHQGTTGEASPADSVRVISPSSQSVLSHEEDNTVPDQKAAEVKGNSPSSVSDPSLNSTREHKPEPVSEQDNSPVKEVITTATLKMDNGTYVGEVKNGHIMHGKGTFTFSRASRIPDDPEQRVAKAGYSLVGVWYDGNIYTVKMYDESGVFLEKIVIGRN